MVKMCVLETRPKLWGSCRLSIAFCVFLASVQMSMLRDDLGLALICMTKPIRSNISCDTNDATMPTLPWLTYKKVQTKIFSTYFLYQSLYYVILLYLSCGISCKINFYNNFG